MNALLSKIKKKYLFAIVVIFLGTIATAKLLGIIINITPSMREGVYIEQVGSIQRGTIVAACIPDSAKKIGLKRLYLGRGVSCDGVMPVIKKVIAIPGDNVFLSDNFIDVNGIKYPYKTKYFDSLGRPLSVYPRGNYLSTNAYWLIGTQSPNSWDSRYWGSISKKQILYKLKPLLVR